jgi:hypothetical protein
MLEGSQIIGKIPLFGVYLSPSCGKTHRDNVERNKCTIYSIFTPNRNIGQNHKSHQRRNSLQSTSGYLHLGPDRKSVIFARWVSPNIWLKLFNTPP